MANNDLLVNTTGGNQATIARIWRYTSGVYEESIIVSMAISPPGPTMSGSGNITTPPVDLALMVFENIVVTDFHRSFLPTLR